MSEDPSQITDILQLDPNKSYLYSDYLKWKINERIELIRGKIFRMSPAPSYDHQNVSSTMQGLLWSHLRNSKCKVFTAPFDVRFISEDENGNVEIKDTVQPDICVVSDTSKLDQRGCLGAPDLVVEILLPSTASKDLTFKYDLYEEQGVQEYWVIHPTEQTLVIHTLNDDQKYVPSRLFTRLHTVKSEVIKGFEIDLGEVFEPFDWSKVEEQEAKYNRI